MVQCTEKGISTNARLYVSDKCYLPDASSGTSWPNQDLVHALELDTTFYFTMLYLARWYVQHAQPPPQRYYLSYVSIIM